jgi:hypothetical protein
MKRKSERYNRGIVALSIVIILAAVLLAVSITSVFLSVGEAQSGLALYKGEDNLAFVEGCAEDYLLKIRANSSFTAADITRPEGTCKITINSGNPNWNITVYPPTTLAYQRKIQVIFTRNATGITITSWKEI